MLAAEKLIKPGSGTSATTVALLRIRVHSVAEEKKSLSRTMGPPT